MSSSRWWENQWAWSTQSTLVTCVSGARVTREDSVSILAPWPNARAVSYSSLVCPSSCCACWTNIHVKTQGSLIQTTASYQVPLSAGYSSRYPERIRPESGLLWPVWPHLAHDGGMKPSFSFCQTWVSLSPLCSMLSIDNSISLLWHFLLVF